MSHEPSGFGARLDGETALNGSENLGRRVQRGRASRAWPPSLGGAPRRSSAQIDVDVDVTAQVGDTRSLRRGSAPISLLLEVRDGAASQAAEASSAVCWRSRYVLPTHHVIRTRAGELVIWPLEHVSAVVLLPPLAEPPPATLASSALMTSSDLLIAGGRSVQRRTKTNQ